MVTKKANPATKKNIISNRSLGKTEINEARFNKDSCTSNLKTSADKTYREERIASAERVNERTN
jgi:hypothetical protein